MDKFIAWMIAFMVSQAPPGRDIYIPEAKESKEEALARYESIARDIAAVVTEEEPLFRGPQGRLKTASVILSIMRHEGAFRKDVDTGVGKMARGDQGRSVCLMQVNVGKGRTFPWNVVKNKPALPADPAGEVVQGWTGAELLADRKNCIRAGYRIIRVSFGSGGGLPPTEWLRVYASGSREGGSRESRSRMGLALRYFSEHRPSFNDADLAGPQPEPPPIEERAFVAPIPHRPFLRSYITPSTY